MAQTRGGEVVSLQIGNMGVIDNLNNANFEKEGIPFNVKNDGEAPVTLEVNLWGMMVGVFVRTRFETGWNPEIVREIKKTSLTNLRSGGIDYNYGFNNWNRKHATGVPV